MTVLTIQLKALPHSLALTGCKERGLEQLLNLLPSSGSSCGIVATAIVAKEAEIYSIVAEDSIGNVSRPKSSAIALE